MKLFPFFDLKPFSFFLHRLEKLNSPSTWTVSFSSSLLMKQGVKNVLVELVFLPFVNRINGVFLVKSICIFHMKRMDGNRKFRSRALTVKTALRFITKTRGKTSYSSENISSDSLSLSAPSSSSSSSPLSKDSHYHQEKHQKRKLINVIRKQTNINQ